MKTPTRCGIVGLATAMVMLGLVVGRGLGAELLVGSASTSITPDKPVALSGQHHLRISKGVESPVTATAIALQTRQGDHVVDQAILISCDLVGVPGIVLEQTRRRIQPLLGDFDPKKLILNATHTHTAPVMEEGLYQIPTDGVMQPTEYVTFLVERLADIAVQAWKSRQPGAVGWGLGHAVVAQNRRAVFADGKAVMYGKTDQPTFRRIEGFEDHGVEALFFWNSKKELQAVAVNMACPTQEVEGLSVVNADFWHQARERLRQRYGSHVNVVAWVGAAGDQSPHLMYRKAAEERMRQARGLTRLEEIARRVEAAVDEAYQGASKDIRTDVPLAHLVQTVRLPIRMVTEEELQEAKKTAERMLNEEKRTGDTSQSRRRQWHEKVIDRYEKQKADPWYETEMHAIRLGDVAICTNPFELFTDYGIQMKAHSKAIQTFVIQLAGNANRGGYLPTEQAVHGGGYSAIIQSNVVGPEGGQILVERTVEAINSLWPADVKRVK